MLLQTVLSRLRSLKLERSGFLFDVTLYPKEENEDKSINAYICNKNAHYFVLVLTAGFTYEAVLCFLF